MSCGCNRQNEKDLRTVYLEDIAIDTQVALPEFLLAERVTTDPMSGDRLHTITRLPMGRVMPNGTQENIFALSSNNDTLEVPTNQVRAGFVNNLGNGYAVQYDDATNVARFLILRLSDTNLAYCQSTGIVNLPGGHDYIVGADYYATADGTGEPTTASDSGRHLFYVLSRTQLLVDIRND